MKKNFICNFILSGLLLFSPLSMFAQRVDSNLPWSVRMVGVRNDSLSGILAVGLSA